MSASWLPALILLMPLVGALLALLNRRAAPYMTLLAAAITPILAILTAL